MRQLPIPIPLATSVSSFLILLLPLLPSISPAAAASASKPSSAIALSEVRSLTLRGGGAQTAHRRVSAVPQLKCVSAPSICRLHAVDVMRCTNQGSGYDAEDIQWSCSAPLPPELKLGSTDVMCEGYSGPNDPYILKGSCGVEYRLVLTETGEQKFPDLAKGGGGWGWGGGGDEERSSGSYDPSAIAFVIIFALVCLWIIYSACVAGNQDPTRPGAQRRRRDNWGGFGGGFDPGFGPGGGGGGGGWDDPPPPYPGGPKFSSTQNQGWRPGFWSGLAGGAAAGYAAGGRRNNQQEPRNSGYGWGAGPSSSSSVGSGSRSTSTARYESTGFGSTSRR
ncbi:DUF1183-domain-containing protein [Annulohypoxylon bovei var. microspora]|nr:DUF1183-domain-containing protein [Annulohypoxylon bovei var. microspora]